MRISMGYKWRGYWAIISCIEFDVFIMWNLYIFLLSVFSEKKKRDHGKRGKE